MSGTKDLSTAVPRPPRPAAPETAAPETAGPAAQAPASGGRRGPLGFGAGPVLAAGLMVGAAVVAAGVGVTQLAVADPAAGPVPGPVAASAEPGWLRLPDANRNGVPDAYETPAAPVPVEPATPVPPSPAPAPPDGSWIWVVRWGDTLSGISAATGVPLEILMRANGITDPNRIYAGSALRITPGA